MDKNGEVLHWSGRVLSADDLRRALNGHRELVLAPEALITPLAADELRLRGVRVSRQEPALATPASAAKGAWGYAQERAEPLVESAVRALAREGLVLRELSGAKDSGGCGWARAVADCVARGDCVGGILFCQDAGLACCVANKLPGLRAVCVANPGQAARAMLSLGANLAVVEVTGRTFFEIRQIIRTLCQAGTPACPAGVARTLEELEGHAHR